MKFKVGDKVELIDEKSYGYGDVFEITEIDTRDPEIPYECKSYKYHLTTWFSEDEITLVEENKEEASEKKENTNMKVFESPNREKYLGDLCFGDYFKFMSGAFKGSFGIVCNYTKNARDHMKDGEKFTDKDPCLIFTDDLSFPVFSIEDTSTEIKKLSGKTIFEED